MKASAPKDFKRPKAVRRPHALRGRRCPRCPFCAPSGACLDTRVRSGRCGDWVFYLLHGKQFRRLWNKPQDPRTPSQRYWRARLGAASRKYSATLTDEQQDACIAAGAKRRSRPRLGQWGWLTGQQFWVRPPWEQHRHASLLPPWQHRCNMGRSSNGEDRSKNGQCRAQRVMADPKARRRQRVTRSSGAGGRNSTLAMRQCAAGSRGTFPVFSGLRPSRCAGGRRAGKLQADWRHGHGAVRLARGPPEQIETRD